MIRTVLTAGLLWGLTASAGPLTLAIVYGHNGGDATHAPLRYAEADAARVGQALIEVGGVAPANLRVLTGRPLKDLEAAFDWARSRAVGHPQTLLVVYLSSHSKAERGLTPGPEALSWLQLKALVAATGAKARITIVDGCEASGLIEASAKEAPTFTLQASDELTVKGDAFITSSASDEPSLEAGQLQGSVFTQHLLAGLRGAADRSGDGQVSLEELYRFAYERTTEGQSGQHPGFATRLSGYGALTLATVGSGPGLLVPEGVERIVVRRLDDRQPLVSARRPEARRLAVPSGDWLVEVEQAGGLREGRVGVTPSGFTSVEIDRLGAVARPSALVRLSGSPLCFGVGTARREPRVDALMERLRAVVPDCAVGQTASATVVVESAPKGQLRVRASIPGQLPLDVSRPTQQSDELVAAVQSWILRRVADHEATKRKP